LKLSVSIGLNGLLDRGASETKDLDAGGGQGLGRLGTDVPGDEDLGPLFGNHLGGLDAGTLGEILVGVVVDEGHCLGLCIKDHKPGSASKTGFKMALQGTALGTDSNFHGTSPCFQLCHLQNRKMGF
jgi:hypothetical protein